jgi:predicted dienelactone hydrolase
MWLRHHEAALGQEVFDIAEAERKPAIHPDDALDNVRRKVVARIRERGHAVRRWRASALGKIAKHDKPLLLTSKGAAGVTGSGFIVLAATLASVGTISIASIALVLRIDRFMSEARID